MRSNRIFVSASSRPNLLRQGSNHKNLNMPMPLPACPSKSFGTFLTPSMPATTQMSGLIFWKTLCLDSLERANGSLTLNCFAFAWKCRASSPVFSWEAQTTSPSGSITWQWPFPCNVFDSSSAIHVRKTVGAGAHGMAAAMVKAADALWDARGGNNPTVAAASTQRNRSPAPGSGKRGDKRGSNARPKSRPPFLPRLPISKTLAMACANFTITMPIGLSSAFSPVLGRKTNSPPDPFQFGGFPHTCHCHSYAFSCKRWLDFFDWRIDQW